MTRGTGLAPWLVRDSAMLFCAVVENRSFHSPNNEKLRVMRNMRIATSFVLTTLLLLWSLAGFKPVLQQETRVQAAAGGSKVSPDLRDKVNSGATGQIPVVFVTPSAPTATLQSAVTGGGGSVKKSLKNVRELTAT